MAQKLTPKQQAFVEEYPVDLNGTQAAIRAGYSEKTARITAAKLLSNANIQEEIQRLQRERSERTKIDSDYVLKQAVKLHERCMQELSPVIDKTTGEQLQDEEDRLVFRFDASGAAKSLELIGKHVDVQAWREQKALSNPDGSPLDFNMPLQVVFVSPDKDEAEQ